MSGLPALFDLSGRAVIGFAGGHGMAQKAVLVATVDWLGSRTDGMVPESSCHMATRPCWKSDRQFVTR